MLTQVKRTVSLVAGDVVLCGRRDDGTYTLRDRVEKVVLPEAPDCCVRVEVARLSHGGARVVWYAGSESESVQTVECADAQKEAV